MGLAALKRGLERNSVTCARRRGGSLRQRHYHLSAVGDCRSPVDCELARIAHCLSARTAETVRLLGLCGLFSSIAECAGVTPEADRFLAVT